MCIDADLHLVEVGLAARPVRRFRESAAAAMGTEIVFDGLCPPLIGRHLFLRRGQAKLRRRVVGPQCPAFRAQRTGAARYAGGRLADFELRVATVAASLEWHDDVPFQMI